MNLNAWHSPVFARLIPQVAFQFRTAVRVVQKRVSRNRVLQLSQTHYEPKPLGYTPIPSSVLGSGSIRRLLKAGTVESRKLIPTVEWQKFLSNTPGVKWHPEGGWRVTFSAREPKRDYFVNASAIFRSRDHGFDRAKELAVAYRSRLVEEWRTLRRGWAEMDRAAGVDTLRTDSLPAHMTRKEINQPFYDGPPVEAHKSYKPARQESAKRVRLRERILSSKARLPRGGRKRRKVLRLRLFNTLRGRSVAARAQAMQGYYASMQAKPMNPAKQQRRLKTA